MTEKDYIKILSENLILLEEAVTWLKRSSDICGRIGAKEEYSENEYDAFEALTSRFARVSDIVIQKVFRSIDKVELEDRGTLIDVINRAHKRELFDSVDKIREIRELRNEIAHEYSSSGLQHTFESVLCFTKDLLEIIDRVKNYCQTKYSV
ncbi:hypothetical protein ACFL4D_02365 [Candidatus Margulisiibacteriota bacterium]